MKGEKPNLEGKVKIHVRGTYNDRVFDERDVEFVIGDGWEHEICDGIEKGVVTMRRYEKSKLFIHSTYAFKYTAGWCEKFNVPPDADVVYEVVLFELERVAEIYEMSFEEKLEKAYELKERGLKCFKATKYEKAIEYYERMLTFVKKNKQDTDYSQTLPFKIAANSNAALCYLKLNDFAKAIAKTERVVKYDAANVKGHFRMGEACMGMKDWKGAVRAYENVLRVEAENQAAKRQLHKAREMMKKHTQYEKQLYTNIFAKMSQE